MIYFACIRVDFVNSVCGINLFRIFIFCEMFLLLTFVFRFLREALNLSRSVLAFKYVVHELIPEKHQYNDLREGDPDWSVWNPEQMAQGMYEAGRDGQLQ